MSGSDNWDSPATEERKRPRLGRENALQDSADVPVAKRATQPKRTHIVGLYDDDEEEDSPVPEPQKPPESPGMRMEIQRNRDCEPSPCAPLTGPFNRGIRNTAGVPTYA